MWEREAAEDGARALWVEPVEAVEGLAEEVVVVLGAGARVEQLAV